jgi:hypothetical protein
VRFIARPPRTVWPTEKDVVEAQAKVEVAEERVREKSAKKPVKKAPSTFYGYMDSATKRRRDAMTKMFQQAAPAESDENYSRKASRATSRLPSIKPAGVLTPAPLSMKRPYVPP